MAPPPAARPSAPEPPLHSRATRLTFPGARSPGSARSPKRRSPRAAPRSGSGGGLPARRERGVSVPRRVVRGQRGGRRDAGRGGCFRLSVWVWEQFPSHRGTVGGLHLAEVTLTHSGVCCQGGVFQTVRESSGSAERRAAAAQGKPAGHGGPAPRSRPRLAPTLRHSVHPALQLVTASKWS